MKGVMVVLQFVYRAQLLVFLIFCMTAYSNVFDCVDSTVQCTIACRMEQQWKSMQGIYQQLEPTDRVFTSQYNHPYWLESRKHIKKLVAGPANEQFFFDPVVENAMVRRGRSVLQEYEILYLKQCISNDTKALIQTYQETTFGNNPWEINEFKCTTNTLGHLYSAARILEGARSQKQIKTIVEFGSGFGNLARILKSIKPNVTLVLIDFPELLALQYLYLNATLSGAEIIAHAQLPATFKEGAIHLVPVFLIENMALEADCFVSTFALSESTEFLQKLMLEKNFFKASLCYITGQIAGWGSLNFVNQTTLLSAMRAIYQDVLCEPFHSLSASFIQDLPSYELLARNQVSIDKDPL